MKAHLFRGPGRVFAVTADPEGSNLPTRYEPWTMLKTIELEKHLAMPGLDVIECLDDLQRYGVHITDAHVRITEDAIR